MRSYVEAVFAMVDDHRLLLASLMRNGLGPDGLRPAIRRLEMMGRAVAADYGLAYDTPVAVRTALLMVVTSALTEDSLYGGTEPIPRSRVIDELTRMLVAAAVGTAGSPSDDAQMPGQGGPGDQHREREGHQRGSGVSHPDRPASVDAGRTVQPSL